MTVPTPAATPATKIPFRFHPRVFAALGADLVTNDVVAVMELVKNAYDAGAGEVEVRFGKDSSGLGHLDIEDDGCGMTREIIEKVWCLVATPHKTENRIVGGGSGGRRVSGERGLGRLSAARLGDDFRMRTRSLGGPCWEVTVRWSSLAAAGDLSEGAVLLKPYEGEFPSSGTQIRIGSLREEWSESQVADLRSNLSRIVPPFTEAEGFSIFFAPPDTGAGQRSRVRPEFLSKPKYRLTGSVNADGDFSGRYRFKPLSEDGTPRKRRVSLSWAQLVGGARRTDDSAPRPESPRCGGFRLDLRAWDLGAEERGEIAHRFELKRSAIRAAISAHRGVSVYRDGILVLPKSPAARDWLGLDFRRVGKVGTRLSTNQIVGMVSISSADNAGLRDTSDRERLAAGPALSDFRELLMGAVGVLEAERDRDRTEVGPERHLASLFEELSATPLVEEVQGLARKGATAEATVPVVESYARRSEQAVRRIETRFAYYSQLATIGTIAAMLVHEIGSWTVVISRFLITMKERLAANPDERLQTERDWADRTVHAMDRLARRFAPMSNRGYRRSGRTAVLEERILDCLDFADGAIRICQIRCEVPESRTVVAVDPGELDTVLLNLIRNAVYWVSGVKDRPKEIRFGVEPSGGDGRVRVEVVDNGPGIADEDLESIFLPGVTRKPSGIGMGLTVASELVAAYDGRLSTAEVPIGAVFRFDLPLARETGEATAGEKLTVVGIDVQKGGVEPLVEVRGNTTGGG